MVKDCVEFNFLTVTDIKSFYPSIYTHSIAWAIEGKDTIRHGNRRNYDLLGNRIDKLFQNARDGQTNGIPIGSMVSDLVAEIILKRVDIKLSEWLEADDLADNIIAVRYRDDYRFLTNSEEEGKSILKSLGKILNSEFNLMLNEDKTNIYSDILEGTIRDWSSELDGDFLLRQVKYEEMNMEISFSYLKDILLKTYKIQKKYPSGRPSITLLSKLITHLDNDDVNFEIDESGTQTLIAILRKISLLREEASAQVFMILDIFFAKLSEDASATIVRQMLRTIEGQKDYDYQVIWLYRLCLAHHPEICREIPLESSELLQLLAEEFVDGDKPDLDIFHNIVGIDEDDFEELKKFSIVSPDIFADAPNKELNKEMASMFSYRRH